MTIAVAQETAIANSASGSSIGVAFASACTVGSTFHVAGSNDTGGGVTINNFSDPTNGTYPANLDNVNDAGNAQRLAHAAFTNNASSGTPTVTCNFSAATTFRGVAIREITGGVTTAPDAHHAQDQAAVGTGVGAISSGAVSNTAQPALISAFAMNTNNDSVTASADTGAGYTLGASEWTNIYGGTVARLFTEHKRVTAIASQAATYTASGAGDNWVTCMAIFDEAAAASGLLGQAIL